MEQISYSTVICPFCGASLDVKNISDDGHDWLGHHRGTEYQYEEKAKCECQLGALENTIQPIKKMCLNCVFYKDNRCTNKEKIVQINSLLENYDIEFTPLLVKNPQRHCEFHQLDYSIFDSLFLNTEDNYI